jgi:hypothetical protein
VLVAVLGVVVVACLVLLGVRLAAYGTDGLFAQAPADGAAVDGGDGGSGVTVDDPRTRALVSGQAQQFVLRFNTYGPADLDEQNRMPGYVERVGSLMTPQFRVGFEQSVTLAEQAVAHPRNAPVVAVYPTRLESLGDDSATVLVAGAFTGSYPDPEGTGDDRVVYEAQPFRYRVSLQRVEERWLVDNFAPASENDEEDPAGTAPPTPGGSGQPSRSGAPSSTPAGPSGQASPSEGGRG